METTHRHRHRTLGLCGMLHAFTHVYHVCLLPLYLQIQRDFKLESVGQATLLMTVTMLAYYLPSYPMGVLADKFSRKKLLAFGLAVNGLGFVLLGLAPSYPMALASVILAGIGGSFFHPAATSLIAGLFPVNTGRALGLLGVGASVGFFAGPIYSGWRTDALLPVLGAAAWRRPVLELGVLGICCAAIFAWLAEDDHSTRSFLREKNKGVKMFPNPALWMIFLATCLAFTLRDFAGNGLGTLGSLFMQKVQGLDVRATGIMLSFIFVATWISNPLFGSFSDRGRMRWITIVLVIAALLMAALPHVSKAGLMPLLIGYGFFFLASYPMVEAALMESVPDAVRGRVFGLFITVGGLIGNLSHWLLGELVRKLGEHAVERERYFPVFGGMALAIIGSILGLTGLRTIRKREELAARQRGIIETEPKISAPEGA